MKVAAIMCAVLFVATVSTAAERDPQAEKIVEEMIEAHGGMAKWRAAPTVCFEDRWITPRSPEGRWSRITVEQTRRRAYMDFPGTDKRMAWDGRQAWSENWDSPAPPRFLALLNYYFLNLPWLTMDPGVNLGDVGTTRLWEDPVEYLTIRMTFDPGVGDTPDDYYVLLIHPETKRLHGCKYVVTYKVLLPEGEKMTPEHILVFDRFETVDGLVVPTRFTIYEADKTVYAECSIAKWSFREAFDETRMNMPSGAVVDESQP